MALIFWKIQKMVEIRNVNILLPIPRPPQQSWKSERGKLYREGARGSIKKTSAGETTPRGPRGPKRLWLAGSFYSRCNRVCKRCEKREGTCRESCLDEAVNSNKQWGAIVGRDFPSPDRAREAVSGGKVRWQAKGRDTQRDRQDGERGTIQARRGRHTKHTLLHPSIFPSFFFSF